MVNSTITQESVFILFPFTKINLIFTHNNYPAIHFFFPLLLPLYTSFLCGILKLFITKSNQREERGMEAACVQVTQETCRLAAPIPHLLSPHVKNNISVDRDENEWATWNLMRFTVQLSSSRQLPKELAAVSP